MALLKIRRPKLKLFGAMFQRGDLIESRDFPADQHKWAQLIDNRYVDLVDKPGAEPMAVDEMSRDEITNAFLDTHRREATAWEATDSPSLRVENEGRRICPDCDFVAKNSHGLKIHAGRAHKKE